LVQKNHAIVKLDWFGFLWNENLHQKQKRTAISTNLKENPGKIKSVFVIRAAFSVSQKAWVLPWIRTHVALHCDANLK